MERPDYDRGPATAWPITFLTNSHKPPKFVFPPPSLIPPPMPAGAHGGGELNRQLRANHAAAQARHNAELNQIAAHSHLTYLPSSPAGEPLRRFYIDPKTWDDISNNVVSPKCGKDLEACDDGGCSFCISCGYFNRKEARDVINIGCLCFPILSRLG